METRRQIILQGITDVLAMFLPAVPFALVLGVAIANSGINPWLGWASSVIVFGGASQLTLITLLGDGAAVAAAVSAALIVNARHLLYSAAMAPTFQQQPRWFRWLGPYLLTDQAFALGMLRINDDPANFRLYYLTVGALFCVLWIVFTGLALVIGPVIPTHWNIGLAVPIMFLGLLVMSVDRWPKVAAAIAAAGTTYLCANLPNGSGLLIGAFAGIIVGATLDRLRR
tara:strand:- start:493220 stop:493900 length:681 start_codon:yes stop_codon:yes gene_type:complete